ncbi:hypothetical protein Tco_0011787 [Tanacetum coccineum]
MEMCYLVNDGFNLHLDERKLFRVSYMLKTVCTFKLITRIWDLGHDHVTASDILCNRVNDAPLDKRRKLESGRIMASTTSSRGRQALAPVTTNQREVVAASSEAQGKQDWMRDYLKRLKVYNFADFSHETPPNLKTTLPDKPLSAGRSRLVGSTTVKGNLERSNTSGSITRRHSSPIVDIGRIAEPPVRGCPHANGHMVESMDPRRTSHLPDLLT